MTHVIKKNDCDDLNQATADFISELDRDIVIDKIDITDDESIIEFHQMEHGSLHAV